MLLIRNNLSFLSTLHGSVNVATNVSWEPLKVNLINETLCDIAMQNNDIIPD